MAQSAPKRPKVEYVIFDMDGLLNIVLGQYGHEMTWDIKAGLMGLPARQSTEYLFSHFPGLEDRLSFEDFQARSHVLREKLFRQVKPMKGAVELVRALHASGVPFALATGSSQENFVIKTSHLPEMFSLFPMSAIITADTPEVLGKGKPKPDIFLVAANAIGRDVGRADECTELQLEERRRGLVFEDARPGVQAALAAEMNVVWVPDPNLRKLAPDETYGASEVLSSLDDFDPAAWGLPDLSAHR